MIRVKLTSILVNDQARARAFYAEKLGFKIKHDVDMGDVDAIEKNRARLRCVVAQDQVGQRRLAASRDAQKDRLAAAGSPERRIAQHTDIGFVAVADRAEFELAAAHFGHGMRRRLRRAHWRTSQPIRRDIRWR